MKTTHNEKLNEAMYLWFTQQREKEILNKTKFVAKNYCHFRSTKYF